MRLVIDLNNIVSGFLWSGPSAFVIQASRNGEATAYLTEDLLIGLAAALRRAKFVARLRFVQLTADDVETEIRGLSVVVAPSPIVIRRLRDADDAQVAACAISADAHMVVTGDKDLLSLRDIHGIPVVRVIDAARALGYRG